MGRTRSTFLNGLDPSLSASYARATANPQTLATNPQTGNVQFVPKGGYQIKAPPMVGAIEQGHRYIGGDPASPTSWQKVQ